MRPRVSLLMYHALVPRHEPYMARVHVEQAQFEAQMAWLAASGHRVIDLAEVAAVLRRPPEAQCPVVLTFDDGYASLHQVARPLLACYGFPATLFLTTGPVGEASYVSQPGFADSVPHGDRPLTWPELRELQVAGWRIEAHGCTHRALATLGPAAQVAELAGSRAAIARHLGRAPAFYAYPYGSYTRRTLQALGPAGYQAACAVHTGPATPASDPRRLPRLEVTNALYLPAFQRLVATGYLSPAARRRAWLRNWLFRSPLLKDALGRGG